MRKSMRKAAVVAGSVALITTMAPMAAQARTTNEFTWCWNSFAALNTLQITVAGDGPAFRKRTLPSGTCTSMNVRKGTYDITIDNAQEIRNALRNADLETICGDSGPGAHWHFTIDARVTRFQQTYTAHRVVDVGPFNFDGFNESLKTESFRTGVKKDRLTKIKFAPRCALHDN